MTIASAREATKRATVRWTFSFSRAGRRSTGLSASAITGSRRSAIHLTPVACLTAAPIRLIEFGGDVVSTASIPSRLTIRIAAGIAFGAQVTALSGTSARRKSAPAW